jgi:hypothetical protein
LRKKPLTAYTNGRRVFRQPQRKDLSSGDLGSGDLKRVKRPSAGERLQQGGFSREGFSREGFSREGFSREGFSSGQASVADKLQ